MERRHDLDWLRVLLFGLLVLYHAAVGFADFGAGVYGFANDRLGGPGLSLVIYFSHGWRLPALFLISGIGTWFATRRSAGLGVMGRRMARLMVPTLFGTFVLNLVAGLAIAWAGSDPRGLLADLTLWWRAPEIGQVLHLWFLVNLTIYTLLCWPLFLLRARIGRWRVSPPALLAILVTGVTLVAVATKPHGAALAGEGYQFPWYLGIFATGYVIGAHHEAVLDWLRRRAFWLIGAGLLTFATEIGLLIAAFSASEAYGAALASGGWAAAGIAPAYGPMEVAFAAVEGVNAFAWSFAALGLAARYLTRPGRWLDPLSRAVFPVYVLHFPVTILGLALLTRTSWAWQVDFLLLAAGTYAVTGLLAWLFSLDRRLYFLVGGRPRRAD